MTIKEIEEIKKKDKQRQQRNVICHKRYENCEENLARNIWEKKKQSEKCGKQDVKNMIILVGGYKYLVYYAIFTHILRGKLY